MKQLSNLRKAIEFFIYKEGYTIAETFPTVNISC